MRTFPALVLCAAALGGSARAQGEPQAKAAAQAGAPTAAKKLDDLIARFNKERSDVIAAYQKAETDEERSKILAGMPGAAYIPEFQALAAEAKGTDTAAKALLWVWNLADDDKAVAWSAVETLLEEHMQSPTLSELTSGLRYASYQHGEATVIEALRAIVDETPHEPVRASGLFNLGAVLLDSKDESNRKDGRTCLEAVIADHGDLTYRNSTYEEAAKAFLYELDNLQIGMAAPDFESVDENGVKWKLSDYRGKVVVVDFWGFW
jgi:hypothetical protein